MAVDVKRITYPEYLETPEIKQRYEILDGEMTMTPAPTPYHQWILGRIFLLLERHVTEPDLGIVLGAQVDVLIQQAPLCTRQPDILYLSAERSGILGPAQLRRMQMLKTPPDLVMEVLSPGNTRDEMLGKLEDYRKVGVRECWLVSPEAETVEVVRISSERITAVNISGIDGRLNSELLQDFTPTLKEFFK